MGRWKQVFDLIGVAATFAASTCVAAQSVDDFYRGRVVDLISTGDAGTAYDLWARLLAQRLPKYLAGNPTFVVKDMPGAGHIRGVNFMYAIAPRDGSVIGVTSDNVAIATVLKRKPDLDIDYSKFSVLGRTDAPSQICLARAGVKVQKAADLFNEPLIVGGAGAGSGPTMIASFIKSLIGMKLEVVEGYKSLQDIFLAVDRGEIDGTCSTLSGVMLSRPDAFVKGTYKLLFNTESKPLAGMNAPTLRDFARTEEQRQVLDLYNLATTLGHPLIAPPGVPAERIEALRKAFDAVVSDPEYLSEAKSEGLIPSPGTGLDWEQQFARIRAAPSDVVKKVADYL